MLIDGRTIPNGQTLQTDVCIIGSGAAGITLARAFSGQSFTVTLLAGGDLKPAPETQTLNAGPNVGLPYFALEYCRARCFGGTTTWWGGHCRPLSDFDFEAKDWIPRSGWPIARKDIQSFRTEAEEILNLRMGHWDPKTWAADSGLKELPLDPQLFETRVAQIISPSSQRRFGTIFRKDIESAANVTTYLNANVVEIDTDETGQTVTALKLACIDGPRFTIVPKVCILAAGGLENPRLLLVSDRVQKAGLGNQHDLVGRFFLEHPRFEAGTFYPVNSDAGEMLYGPHKLLDGTAIKSYFGLTPGCARAEEIVDVQLRMERLYDPAYKRSRNSVGFNVFRRMVQQIKAGEVPESLGSSIATVFSDIDNVALATYMTAFKKGLIGPMRLTARVDPTPNPDSRVTLIDQRDELGVRRVQLDWRLTPQDKRSARRVVELFAQAVGKSGLGRVHIGFEDDGSAAQWPPSLAGGYHHMGTTRMSDDPKQGVVDRDCRVHGMSNLWVAGSSVFPTAGSGTPTMMIITLALRLAEDVKKRMA
ncbi:MAG: GMC family oxidoreductase [Vicinamibacterales bacterium]